jgi:hypothetical protein
VIVPSKRCLQRVPLTRLHPDGAPAPHVLHEEAGGLCSERDNINGNKLCKHLGELDEVAGKNKDE